jgi:outer membrane protein TolC
MKKLLIACLCIPLFGSSLNELIGYAINNSNIIKKAKTQVELSKLKQKESRQSRFGKLDLVASYNHYNIERTLAPLPPSAMKSGKYIVTSKNIYSVGLNYSVPLFTGFAQTQDIKIQDIAKSLASAKVSLTKEELAYNIKSLYTSALSLQDMLSAQNSYIRALKELNKQISYEVKLGKKAQIDQIKAQADTEEAIANKEAIKANIDILKASLSAIVGKRVTKLAPIKIRVTKSLPSVNSLVRKSASLNKVRVKDLTIAKSNQLIKKSQAKNYPQVNLNIYAGKNYAEDINKDKWSSENLSQISLNVKYNITDFGASNAKIEQAKVANLQAKLDRAQTILELKRDIIKARAQIRASFATYSASLKRYKLTKKAQSIEEVRYQNSISTINDLLLAKAKTMLARAKVIDSKYNYKKSRYYLDYIMEKGIN